MLDHNSIPLVMIKGFEVRNYDYLGNSLGNPYHHPKVDILFY